VRTHVEDIISHGYTRVLFSVSRDVQILYPFTHSLFAVSKSTCSSLIHGSIQQCPSRFTSVSRNPLMYLLPSELWFSFLEHDKESTVWDFQARGSLQ